MDIKKAILREALKGWSRGWVYDPEMFKKTVQDPEKPSTVDEVALKRAAKQSRNFRKK